ncbi:unnamed protein product [Ilex paraguariensis]|uniref:Uncharacterized protein n=1 Tax=Ilex paraguariensis TaxID=185542 RepID=A0ABC8TZ74_9AQUA
MAPHKLVWWSSMFLDNSKVIGCISSSENDYKVKLRFCGLDVQLLTDILVPSDQ